MPTPLARATVAAFAAVAAPGALVGAALLVTAPLPASLHAQPPAQQDAGVVRGRVTEAGSGRPIPDAQVSVDGRAAGALTGVDGGFTIARVPSGTRTIRVRRIGFESVERAVVVAPRAETRLDVSLTAAASVLQQVVVTALGREVAQRSLGTAQQTVSGQNVAETQRENFVNALQGRVAGVNVTSTSGTPGASASITIRGVSSISGSNQPLFIVDGLPIDNKTLNSNVLASDAPGSATAFNNRGVDFTNRAADINPEDIESITVLKGAEASALYGIDAANGAIVITTKRGRAGTSGFQYSNNFRFDRVREAPEVQREFQPSALVGTSSLNYFGPRYADTTTFYNNIDGFFRTGENQQHNLSFNGAAPDGRVNYRISTGVVQTTGVVPNNDYQRINLTGASGGQVNRWLATDLSVAYTRASNDQTFKGGVTGQDGGPLIGLLVWPGSDDARNYLTSAGSRRRLTTLAQSAEVDNPYFNINRNSIESRNSRIVANLGLTFTPFGWGSLSSRVGTDSYTNTNQLFRHPESALGFSQNGIMDVVDDVTRNVNVQNILQVNRRRLVGGLGVSGLLGNQINDFRSQANALLGQNFLDPNFVSINNAALRGSRTTLAQRRLIGAYGSAQFDWNDYLFVTLQGRNDWTSTIPRERNSFFYPSVTSSFVFSDAFPGVRRFLTGKLRAAYAEVGKDARPYAYAAALEAKTTVGGGYGFGFTGPNPNLRPEFARSWEFGTELHFLQDRLTLDVTTYRKQTRDQIVNDIRGSYGTGYILFNLNGAVTRNAGVEVSLRGTPVRTRSLNWDVNVNYDQRYGRVLSLPNALPESYVSDTWLYGNIRNGVTPGLSTESLTGFFYLRNRSGQLVIDPTTGLPLRSTTFIDAGYNRTPRYTVGLENTVRFRRAELRFLLDMRRGGDIFNATQHYLFSRGLAMNTVDRNTPRVIAGVLRDGRENTANPTPNNIVVVPAVQTGFYTGASEELFIERNINWVRLADLRLSYRLPARFGRNASLFVAGTDLFLFTNYSGLDPVVNGNSAAVGGSGGVGIDFGNFPRPRGLQFGATTGF